MIGASFGNFASSGGGGTDADAQAFIDAAGITGETQQSALNQLVLDLKGTGSTTNNTDVWSKCHAVYPFTPIDGSTANATCYKFNLKDPRDLDAAFRLTFFNSPTVSYDGVAGDGASAYLNTHYNPSVSATLNNTHISNYQDNNWVQLSNNYGVRTASTLNFGGFISGVTLFDDQYSTTLGRLTVAISNATTDKFRVITSRPSSGSHVIYENGTSVASNATSGGGLPNADYYILTQNGISGFSSSTQQFYTLGLGLTADEAKDLDDSIEKYNTALGR